METTTVSPESRDRRSASSDAGEGGRRRRRLFGRVYRKPTSRSTWYIRYPDPERRLAKNGRVREVVRAVPSKRAAEALLAEVRKALYSGNYAPPPPALAGPAALGRQENDPRTSDVPPGDRPRTFTVLDALDEFIHSREVAGRSRTTLVSYRGHRDAIARSPLGTLPAEAVTPADIEAFRAWRRERSFRAVRREGCVENPEVTEVARAASDSTVNRALTVLGATCNRLVKLGRLRENPVARVSKAREARHTRVALSKEEARRLIDAAGPALRPLIMAGLYTGARRGELLRLTWADMNFESGTIALFRPKVGNASRIPLHPRLAEELRRLREGRARTQNRAVPDDEPIFLARSGRPWVTIQRAFQKALKTAGLGERKGLCFHSLRHTFAVHFLEGGAAVPDLQGLLGHADLTTTQIYARMVDSRTRESLMALDYGTTA
jgi:integrase/recombinase XerD